MDFIDFSMIFNDFPMDFIDFGLKNLAFFCPKQAADIFLSMSYIGRSSPIKVGIRFKRNVSAFRIFCPILNSLKFLRATSILVQRSDEKSGHGF